jgi:hypothetical protein
MTTPTKRGQPLRLLRPNFVYGPGSKTGIGKTKFRDDYMYHEGGDEFIPGTRVRRLKPIPLGERAIGFAEDEVDALIEALRSARDAAE